MKNKKNIQFIENGFLVSEQTEGLGILYFLYTTWIGRKIRLLVNGRFVSQLSRYYQNTKLSTREIAPFIAKHKIKMDDFEQPAHGYRSFNDFFIRKLKPGRRTIDMRPEVLVSPADSKLFVIPEITKKTKFFVKELAFNLELFLGDCQLAHSYAGASMLIFRLAPYDYHRFHFPTNGIPESPIIISGRFDSVNPLVYKAGYQPLLSNERHIIKLHTQEFDTILIIPVGALMVGKIVETYSVGQQAFKGDEAGYFAFGGSTVVVLCKPGVINIKKDFIENSAKGFETVVKMGEGINF